MASDESGGEEGEEWKQRCLCGIVRVSRKIQRRLWFVPSMMLDAYPLILMILESRRELVRRVVMSGLVAGEMAGLSSPGLENP